MHLFPHTFCQMFVYLSLLTLLTYVGLHDDDVRGPIRKDLTGNIRVRIDRRSGIISSKGPAAISYLSRAICSAYYVASLFLAYTILCPMKRSLHRAFLYYSFIYTFMLLASYPTDLFSRFEIL